MVVSYYVIKFIENQNNDRLSRFIYNIDAVIGHYHIDRTIINIK